MASLSIGSYGAVRYHYNDRKKKLAKSSNQGQQQLQQQVTSNDEFEIHTPWMTRSVTVMPTRRDVIKDHRYEIGWQTKIYDPLDTRTRDVPSIARTYPLKMPCVGNGHVLNESDQDLYRNRQVPAKYGTSMKLGRDPVLSHSTTSCNEWSTLRQMLPQRMPAIAKANPENWGTQSGSSSGQSVKYGDNLQQKQQQQQENLLHFPMVNSAMSRFYQDTYFHDRNFKLFTKNEKPNWDYLGI